MHEPFLLRLGLLKLTPRGRVATAAAHKYFGTELPGRQTDTTPAPIRTNKVQTSNRLGLAEFGTLLLTTEDLDPVYTMLYRTNLSTEILHRFLLGYWFFYHVGVAARLTEFTGPEFFARAMVLARDKGTPRGAERRHFRGRACLRSLDYFTKTYGDPNRAVADLIHNCHGKNVTDVLTFVQRWPLFGPWIAFKIGDMLERVGGVRITFRKEDLELYKAPTAGAKIWCANEGLNYNQLGLSGVITLLEQQFEGYTAPPSYDRPVGVQELESVLCKWHSHLHGHYAPGKDSKEILAHLEGWRPLAEQMRQYVPLVGTEVGAGAIANSHVRHFKPKGRFQDRLLIPVPRIQFAAPGRHGPALCFLCNPCLNLNLNHIFFDGKKV